MDAITTLTALTTKIDALVALGIDAPSEFTRLRQQLDTFLNIDFGSASTAIADAVRAGRHDDVPPLMAFAAAAGNGRALADIRQAVVATLMPELKALATAFGSKAHAALAKRFNAAAVKLAAGLDLAGGDLSADDVLRLDSKAQSAFIVRTDLLSELTELASGLRAAAELAGIGVPTNDAAASLVVDFDKVAAADNRRIWELIDNHGLDWIGLATLGVLGARPLGMPLAARHPGLIEKWVPNGIGMRRTLVDPLTDKVVAV